MAFSSRFGRGNAAPEAPQSVEQPTGEEIVIDAEATEVTEAPSNTPIRRAAAVPEATDTHAVAKRSDREIAVRNVAVATAGGLVAGAATIAVAAVAKTAAKNASAPTPGLSRRRKKDILQSQSFLVDVHVLKSGR
jgi:hypothetical protein